MRNPKTANISMLENECARWADRASRLAKEVLELKRKIAESKELSRWEQDGDSGDRCAKCGFKAPMILCSYKFCPECGRRMSKRRSE